MKKERLMKMSQNNNYFKFYEDFLENPKIQWLQDQGQGLDSVFIILERRKIYDNRIIRA